MKKEPKKPSKMTGIRTKISLMMVVLLAVVVLTLTLTLFSPFERRQPDISSMRWKRRWKSTGILSKS